MSCENNCEALDALVAPPGPEALDHPYPDWDESNSRVVSGPLGTSAKFPGKRYHNWRAARIGTEATHHIYAFWTLGERWFARVPRVETP